MIVSVTPNPTPLGAALLLAAALSFPGPASAQLPAGFPTLDGIEQQMAAAAADHPSICSFVDLTATYGAPPTVGGRHLFAVKISDNVAVDEDEPSFLMVAAHHGNEYGTVIVALDALQRLTTGYAANETTIRRLVDEYEIWIAPVWNPDGYPDDRENGNGVDLNRNYPFLWDSSCNNGVKGPSPGSEPETKTMIAWSDDRRFTKVLDFHSSGQEVLYGYSQSCTNNVLSSYLRDEAVALSTASSYAGDVRGPSSNGEHYEWQLGTYSSYAFLTEIGTTQSPTISSAENEADRVWPGTLWMLDRPLPVWGRVTDGNTSLPVEASITYLGFVFTEGERNRAEPRFGRYHAFLPQGAHSLRFEYPCYETLDVVANVFDDMSDQLDVVLQPLTPGLPCAPTTLVAVLRTAPTIQIDLTWTDNSVDEQAFELQRSEDDGATFVTIESGLPPDAEAYADAGDLAGGTTYSYRVRAANQNGPSGWSGVASAPTTPADPVCDADGACDAGEDCNNCPSDCNGKTNGKPQSQFCCDGDVAPNCGDDRCNSDEFSCGLVGPPTPTTAPPPPAPTPTPSCGARNDPCGGPSDPICCSSNCKNGSCKGGRRLGQEE